MYLKIQKSPSWLHHLKAINIRNTTSRCGKRITRDLHVKAIQQLEEICIRNSEDIKDSFRSSCLTTFVVSHFAFRLSSTLPFKTLTQQVQGIYFVKLDMAPARNHFKGFSPFLTAPSSMSWRSGKTLFKVRIRFQPAWLSRSVIAWSPRRKQTFKIKTKRGRFNLLLTRARSC